MIHDKRNDMKVLDLYCKQGGAGMGYFQAGCQVVGVDIEPQPKYPFEFIQADALEYLKEFGERFDLIHASPVCKRFSTITRTAGTQESHPDQIAELRKILVQVGKPYVIENVVGAPLKNALMLCGTMFGLNVIRHRLFETSPTIWFPPFSCNHSKRVVKHGRKPNRAKHYAAVTGHFSDVAFAGDSMGIDWMNQDGLSQAIPPAYTRFIAKIIQSKTCMKIIDNQVLAVKPEWPKP